ncbi:MAG TPA: twin-arginine translocation pathway signal protein [Maribacter sp.]|uniref:nucleoside hydrolase n=1 Tax=unclassified Maribacter TaxID=2615042 RepID=UPI000ED932E5|nr:MULTISPECIES: nucleoside hydrolase [unclassified Maribacter]HAF78789.1 twin-arginine translocation pathway signal protein [Maribacter sp.]|tara:strand:+ start:82217 stop:83236 length:1020 start_codon:yes stop_codon:yes gene_type:complete
MRSIFLILFLVISSFGFSQQTRLEELNSLVKPRMRVIIDNDLGGDPDGLFQLAHHLMSPSVEIRGIIASHLYEQGFGGPGTSEYAKEQAMKVINILGLENSVNVYIDKSRSMVDVTKPIDSEAVQVIIKEAMRTDTDLPLYVVCGGGLTNIASAYLLEPEIAEKLTLVWIGGPEYTDIAIPPPGYTTLEYNLGIDIKAAQVIFNDSDINIWQVPRNVYRQPIMSDAELLIKVKGKGKLGNHLFNVMKEAYTKLDKWNIPMGEVYIYGDNPLVLLTALQSSFEPDPSSSSYVIKQAPIINEEGLYKVNLKGRNIRVYQQLDNRLLFDDFFTKLVLLGVEK